MIVSIDRRLRFGALLAICLLSFAMLANWDRRQPAPELTIHDHEVIEKSVQSLEERLRTLPDDHNVTLRYGRFESLKATAFKKREGHTSSFGPGLSYPTHLTFECLCQFEKYTESITVSIFPGHASYDLSLDLNPSQAAVTNGPLSDCKITQQGNHVFYVREGGDHLRVKSILSCSILDPGFHPE